MESINLRDQLSQLPPIRRDLLDRCAALARDLGAPPYLVGGTVRDLILGRRTLDLDLVVVGDVLAVARAAHAALGGHLVVHAAFGTATLTLPDGPWIDLITARHEHYPAHGALPVVAPGTLDEDLRRRDFTLNALAIALTPADYGTLIDPLGGRADLISGTVRILHDASFLDDPTRLLRAVRYAERLTAGTDHPFAFDSTTAARFDEAVAAHAVATISVQRLAHEFIRLLAEPAAAAMLAYLATTGLLPQIESRVRWDDTSAAQFATLDRLWPLAERPDAIWQGRFALLAAHQPPDLAADTAAALHLPASAIDLAREAAALRQLAPTMPAHPASAELGRLLDPYSPATIVTAAALLSPGSYRDQLQRYLTTIRPLKPALTGDAIRALGVPPGPIYRHALAALRDHKRNHPALTTDDERAFLIAWLREQGALAQ